MSRIIPKHDIIGWKTAANDIKHFSVEVFAEFVEKVHSLVCTVHSCEASADAGHAVEWPSMRVEL
jgi:hypothetical protein